MGGKTGVNEPLSEDLREADVNVIDFQTCNQAYEEYGIDLVESVMFCAGKSGWDDGTHTHISTCEGDSGGPIVKRDVNGNDLLLGIVSFGADECGSSNHPTVFAKVSEVYDWVIDNINYWDCHRDPEENQGQGWFSWFTQSAQQAQELQYEMFFNMMSCSFLMDDTTIELAVSMYIRKRNIATLIYSDPRYWDTTEITNMECLFQNAASFNEDISQWDVSKVTDTRYMFLGATSFNQDLSQWDMSQITKTRMMFYKATSFNQDLSQWVVSEVYNSYKMFEGATSFNQNLCTWNILGATNGRMFFESGCPTASIDYGDPSDTSVCQSCNP